MIPYGRQDISQADIDAVVDVLKSDYLTQGPRIEIFENKIAKMVNAKNAIAYNSATSALHGACFALGVSSGDWVWTSAITYAASSNCALYLNAKVDFVDIDPDTINMCPKKLEEKLAEAKTKNELPKVLVVVHMAGQPCQMKEIKRVADQYGVKIIEDASHALGARFEESITGDCQYSDITIFSFHPVKIITTAEGGVATTNDSDLAQKLSLFRTHGVTREPSLLKKKDEGGWYYEQILLGYNYRMTEVHAALGEKQLDRLAEFVDIRNQRAKNYDEAFKNFPIKFFTPKENTYSSYHLYLIQLNETNKRKEAFTKLREAGIGVNVHYLPVYQHPYYQGLEYKDRFSAPNAEAYYAGAISIPLYPGLTDQDQEKVMTELKNNL